jgi:hypothetical protein
VKLTADQLAEWKDVLRSASIALECGESLTRRDAQRLAMMKRELQDAYLEAVREECGG